MLPDPVGGSDGRNAARRELSKEIYHRDDPSRAQQLLNWVHDRVGDLFNSISGSVSRGPWGVIVVVAIIALVVAVVIRLGGAPPVRDLLGDRDTPERLRNAADERAEADRFAAGGAYAEAIRCSARALVRELEERAVIEPRPGRTPQAIATEVAGLVPAAAADTRLVIEAFEEVWYGGRPASESGWLAARQAEARVRTGRLAVR